MQAKLKRIGAAISLAVFAIAISISAKFHAEISESEELTYVVLAVVGLSILSSAYFLPRALGSFLRRTK
jgi:hypothetical protein